MSEFEQKPPGRLRHTLRWGKGLAQLIVAQLVILVAAGGVLAVAHPSALGPYLVTLAVPTIGALGIVSILVVRSPYTKLALELGTERARKGPGVLGIVLSENGRVLVNRQSEPPWAGFWLALGGYHSDENENFVDVAARRVRELTNRPDLRLRPPEMIGKASSFAVTYMGDSVDAGHAPIDVYAYWITNESNGNIPEAAIASTPTLKWWSLKDLEDANGQIPFHHRDLLLGILTRKASQESYEYWRVEPEILRRMFS
jgi:ADP-ribose pyrophosphatase YjhB (NUDIX family)